MQATDGELLLAHSPDHIAEVEGGFDPEAGPAVGDIYFSAGTAHAARTAAGCTIGVRACLATLFFLGSPVYALVEFAGPSSCHRLHGHGGACGTPASCTTQSKCCASKTSRCASGYGHRTLCWRSGPLTRRAAGVAGGAVGDGGGGAALRAGGGSAARPPRRVQCVIPHPCK